MISNLGRRTRAFSLAGMALGAVLALPAVPAGAADIHRGGTLYGIHCAVCHGANGAGVLPGTPNFRRIESLMRPDMQLLLAIRQGKGAMPGYFGILRDSEILDVIAYLRTLN